MRAIAVCLLALLACAPARAQVVCPFTPAAGNHSDTCANTAFVGKSAGAVIIATAVNFNATGDTALSFTLPAAHYSVRALVVRGKSGTFGTAKAGLYTAASQGGTQIAAQQVISISSTADNTSGNELALSISQISLAVTSLYFNVGTQQGAAAVGNVYLYLQPES